MKKSLIAIVTSVIVGSISGVSIANASSEALNTTAATQSSQAPIQLAHSDHRYHRSTWCERHPKRCAYKARSWCERHPKRCTHYKRTWCERHPKRCANYRHYRSGSHWNHGHHSSHHGSRHSGHHGHQGGRHHGQHGGGHHGQHGGHHGR